VGAGGWVRTWERYGDARVVVPGAHNLYLETLAELGPVGLLLLLGALLIPVVTALRERGDPVRAAMFGCFSAFLAHAALDYDWQVPAVTAFALIAAGCVVITPGASVRLPFIGRASIGVAAAVLAVLAAVNYVGVEAATLASSHLAVGRTAVAEHDARVARAWQPWSPSPLIILAEAEIQRGHVNAGRAYLRQAERLDPADPDVWAAIAAATRGSSQNRALRQAARFAPLAHDIKRLCLAAPAGVCEARSRALRQVAAGTR
jgi:hypothetical protein